VCVRVCVCADRSCAGLSAAAIQCTCRDVCVCVCMCVCVCADRIYAATSPAVSGVQALSSFFIMYVYVHYFFSRSCGVCARVAKNSYLNLTYI